MKPSRLLALALVSALCASCAPDPGPVEIPPDQLPESLARGAEPFPGSGTATARMYLVRGGRLVRVLRDVPTETSAAETVMLALLEGPTADERSQGIETAVPGATQLLGIRILQGVAHVDLSDEFEGPAEPTIVLLRIAQVVWTLAGVPDVVAVGFAVEGEAIGVPTEDRAVVEGPVSALDYSLVAPTD